jgi:hypothetical protein
MPSPRFLWLLNTQLAARTRQGRECRRTTIPCVSGTLTLLTRFGVSSAIHWNENTETPLNAMHCAMKSSARSATSVVYTVVYISPSMVCSGSMFEVKRTDAFDSWLKGLKDSKGRTKIHLLLCGGDKGSQDADIKNAHAMWRELNPPAKKPAKKE